MKTMTVGELKARFSEVLEMVRKGEEVVISYGKKKERVAVLLPFSHYGQGKKRKLGLLKGRASCVIHKDFKITDEEMLLS
ncbi:MAG: type II toxin-antitoxin system prevent-host-death family antitoxin [Desulfobacteraceae bacterium]|nr:MAG: type II toxin-antitoxin system prevent-host-death family antitoxin [Desulfobacteraceae bacterium]